MGTAAAMVESKMYTIGAASSHIPRARLKLPRRGRRMAAPLLSVGRRSGSSAGWSERTRAQGTAAWMLPSRKAANGQRALLLPRACLRSIRLCAADSLSHRPAETCCPCLLR